MITHRARDVHKCLKGIGNFTDKQAKVVSWDSDHLEWITIQVAPKEGPYCGGKYDFKVTFGKSYPKQPPQVDCITPIYHPNIDMTGDDYNVCLSLFDDWQSSFGLEDVIQGILFLMYNPNLEDPLSPWFDPSMNAEEFKENIQKTLRGQVIEDAINYEFPKMIDSDTKVYVEDTSSQEDKNEGEEEKKEVDDTKPSVTEHSQNVSDIVQQNNQANVEQQTQSKELHNENSNDVCKNESNSQDITSTDPVDHEEMVGYIENTFLTGFGELLAIDITSDHNSDYTNSDYSEDDDDDDDESYYFPEDEFEEPWLANMEAHGEYLLKREQNKQCLLQWLSWTADVVNSTVELYVGLDIMNSQNEDKFKAFNTDHKTEHIPSANSRNVGNVGSIWIAPVNQLTKEDYGVPPLLPESSDSDTDTSVTTPGNQLTNAPSDDEDVPPLLPESSDSDTDTSVTAPVNQLTNAPSEDEDVPPLLPESSDSDTDTSVTAPDNQLTNAPNEDIGVQSLLSESSDSDIRTSVTAPGNQLTNAPSEDEDVPSLLTESSDSDTDTSMEPNSFCKSETLDNCVLKNCDILSDEDFSDLVGNVHSNESVSSDDDCDLIIPGLFESESDDEDFYDPHVDPSEHLNCEMDDTDTESEMTINLKTNDCDKLTFRNIIFNRKYEVTYNYVLGYCGSYALFSAFDGLLNFIITKK